MYSLEQSLAYWNDAGRYGSVDERLARAELWQPYYSKIASSSADLPYSGDAKAARTVDLMLREGILRHNDSVLDIGAGMGGHSMEFARVCSGVTALDMNADCLDILQGRAVRAGLPNIRTVATSWEQYAEDGKFDVTFSAMCPAICNQEELLRLERITRRTACLLTVTRGSYDKCRMELMRQLPLKRPGGMVTEAPHYYNVLCQMGRRPGLECWSERRQTSVAAESLIDRYAVYLKIFGVEETASVPFMREFFEKRTVNGVVEDESLMNYALVYWNVPNNREDGES